MRHRKEEVRIYGLCLLIAMASPRLSAQVFEVNGGASSLYQAQGGTLTARGPSYDASLSGGVVAGKLVGGANLTRVIGRGTYVIGDDYIPFVLPTDNFDTSHYLVAVGAGAKGNVRGADVFAFAGAISNSFSSPLFEGVRAESPAGVLFLRRPLGPHWAATSNMIFSRQTTAIEGLQWRPGKFLDAAVAAGVGADQPYGAASVDLNRSRIDVKAAYIAAGSQFHRVAVAAPLMSEPDRENVMVLFHPVRVLTLAAGRNNFLSPVGDTQASVRSSVDDVSAGWQWAGTGLTTSLYHSTYLGNWNNAAAYTAERSLGSWLHTSASYLESRPSNGPRTKTFVSNLTEKITPRLDVTQLISRSQGQTTVSFGGGLLTNPLSITAEYQTYYVPERNSAPFEQALIVDVQLRVFHGITLHGGSFVAPDGGVRYTADAQAVAVREGGLAPPGVGEGSNLDQASIGGMLIRGTVVDTEKHPVPGAALMIDGLRIYTDDDGMYSVRERKGRPHRLRVLGDQFLNGGTYRVVSAPETISGMPENDDPETVIIVERAIGAGK
jgi:hypothetical protein